MDLWDIDFMRFYVQNKRVKEGISKMNFEIKTDNSKIKYTWSVRAKLAVISEECETQYITGKGTRLSSYSKKKDIYDMI